MNVSYRPLPRHLARAILLLAISFSICPWPGALRTARAQDQPPVAGPGWLQEAPAPISPDQARTLLAAQGEMAPQATTPSETAITDEIAAQALALKHDPRLIFDYVHNQIDYTPVYGAINGATATLLAGRGSDCDQAALLIALLRAAGYDAQFVTGDVTYSADRLANWVGASASEAHYVLGNGGIPIELVSGGAKVLRVWVEVNIGGTWYTFDPAMKEYQARAGLSNLGAILGYNQGTFMGRAQSGATVTAEAVQNLNEANIRSDLATYSMNLVNHLRSSLPTASVDDVAGGRRILASELGGYPTALPFAQAVANLSARMASTPVAMRHTLSITRSSHPGDNVTFYTSAIAARRVTIFYDEGAGASVLRVDSTPVVTYTATPTGTQFTIDVAIDHPLTIRDQQGDFDLQSGTGSYAIVHDWNGVSPALLARRNQLLAQAVFQGLHRGTEAVRGEALNIMGQVWMHQVALYDDLVDHLNHTRTLTQHRVGILGQEDGYYIDIPLDYSALASTDGASDVWLSGRVQTMMASAFEHGVLLQLQDHTGFGSVSTIRMLQFNNAQGGKTFLATAGNWSSIRGQLVDYAAGELAWFDTLIGDGYELVLSQDGRQAVGSWAGVGYIQRQQTANSASMGMIIDGGYAGGYTDQSTMLDGRQPFYYPGMNQQPWTLNTPRSRDPVDMVSGMFVFDHTDLVTGPAEPPLGLRFARSYAGQNNYLLGPLGYGWSHSYQWSAGVHSNGAAGLGAGGAINAAAQIAFTHVALDLLAGQLNPQGWTTTAIATNWAMDQLIDNVVTLRTNEATQTFLKLADGSFNPPVGTSDLLTPADGGYLLKDRFGAQYTYDAAGRIATWQDANNNTTTFSYDGQGQLQQVTDALGSTLTFAYTGERLTTVTASGGRTIGFAYSGDRLTACTDPDGVVWRYGYDADNRLTQLFAADSTTAVQTTNVYDRWGRVQRQSDALGNRAEFLYSGYRNIERFPDGGEVVYFLDSGGLRRPGLYVARQDQAGTRTLFRYDGLARLAGMTDRLGDTVSLTYHAATGRLATVTNGRGKTTTYTYALRSGSTVLYDLARIDRPGGAFEEFTYDAAGNRLTWRDTRGGTWTYTYNARGQLLTEHNPTGGGVTYTYKPDGDAAAGARASFAENDAGIGAVTFGYDAHKRLARIDYPGGANEQYLYDLGGRLTRYTDRLGTVYTFAYDAAGNLVARTRGAGLALAQTDTYAYNAMDHLLQSTDPAGAQTQFVYNSLGDVSQMTLPGGAIYALGYDTRRWLDRVTDPAGNLWQATRDSESILTSATTPEGRQVALGSNAMGNFTQITDPVGNAASVEYDDMDRVIRIVDRLNRAIDIARNTGGDVTTITMPVIGQVVYTRNLLGLVTRIADPRGKHWDFAYSGMGRLSQVTDPMGRAWAYAYDALGRISTITAPDGVVETRSYDANDNLTRRQFDGGLALAFTYDELNRLTATASEPVAITYDNRSRPTDTVMGATHWGATYDARGHVQTVTYDGQMVVTYSHDSRGLLTEVQDDKTGAWISLGYDDDMLLIRLERANGVHTDITRNANGRITKIKHGDLGELELSYDAEEQITQILEKLPLDVAAFLQPELLEFGYDDANQVNSVGYAFDARGRRTADPQRSYTWDAADRLVRIGEGGADVDLAYTAQGDVARRTVNGVTTSYFYNHAIVARPIMAEQRGGAYARFYVYTPDGRLLYAVDTPATAPAAHFYHFNHLGTTLFLTDAAGAVADTYGYTAYGTMVKHLGESDQPFTFVGEHGVRQEGMSGLYHMRARYYDSHTSQFLSRDPLWPILEDPKSLNPYQYAGQNPLSNIDPSGEIPSQADMIAVYNAYANQMGSIGVAAGAPAMAPLANMMAGSGMPPPGTSSLATNSVVCHNQDPVAPAASRLGNRDSSAKPYQLTDGQLPTQAAESMNRMPYVDPNPFPKTVTTCLSWCRCSVLDLGAAASPLPNLLGGLALLVLLSGAWRVLRVVVIRG